MSKIWDDLKSNVKDWSNAAVEKAEEVSKVAVAKTEELTKLSKIKLAIHQLQRDKGKEFLLLGKLAYNHSKEANMSNFTGNAEFFAHIEKIDALSKQIVEKEKAISEGIDYFNNERFWECHEILEGVWKNCDGNEKFLVQGLILVAAGLVHYQKDEDLVCISIFNRALEKLENSNGQYHDIDIDKIKQTITEMITSKSVSSFLI